MQYNLLITLMLLICNVFAQTNSADLIKYNQIKREKVYDIKYSKNTKIVYKCTEVLYNENGLANSITYFDSADSINFFRKLIFEYQNGEVIKLTEIDTKGDTSIKNYNPSQGNKYEQTVFQTNGIVSYLPNKLIEKNILIKGSYKDIHSKKKYRDWSRFWVYEKF